KSCPRLGAQWTRLTNLEHQLPALEVQILFCQVRSYRAAVAVVAAVGQMLATSPLAKWARAAAKKCQDCRAAAYGNPKAAVAERKAVAAVAGGPTTWSKCRTSSLIFSLRWTS